MDGQLDPVKQDIRNIQERIVRYEQKLAVAEQAGNKEEERKLFDMLLSLNNQLSGLQEEKNILLRSQAPRRAMNLQAACPDEQASKYAAYLQSQAGKQQLESASGLSLPTGTSLMGLPQYGRQLYMRPSYLQLKDILAQLLKDADPYVDKTVLVSGTPGIGKSFCALYLATHFIAQGIRVVYEFHPVSAAGPTIWYHFPPNSSQGFLSYHWEEVKPYTDDVDAIYLADGGLPLIPSPMCWCYAFLSPQRQVYRWATKSPSSHLLFLPLWTLDELQGCRSFVTIFEEGLSSESVTEAYEVAGGIPRTVLQFAAHQSQSGIPVKDLVLDALKMAVGRLSSQALQDASNQILATGYHESSDKIFHMSCHGVLLYGFPQVVYATQFAAQLVFYKLGEAARRQQLAWFHSASDHTHWQVARGYWFESMAHQVLSNGGDFSFRLLGSSTCYTLRLPAASELLVFTSLTELAHVFQVDSMASYAQPKYSNHPTFDALNCGTLCFQITVAKKQSQKMAGFIALKAARLPCCNLNNYVEPPLSDGVKLLHMIVTTPDRFDTCYQKQNVKKQGAAEFQTGVMKIDLSAAFDRLRQGLGEAAAGLNDLEAMAIDTDVQD
ncbi:hypothetical protein ABBQ32_14138 [Trebouxia sp. C0010 RCD-2024]